MLSRRCAVDPRLAQCEAPTGGKMKLQLPDDCPSAYLFASPRYLTDLNPTLRLTSQAFEHRSDPLAATNAHRHERVASTDALQFVNRLGGKERA